MQQRLLPPLCHSAFKRPLSWQVPGSASHFFLALTLHLREVLLCTHSVLLPYLRASKSLWSSGNTPRSGLSLEISEFGKSSTEAHGIQILILGWFDCAPVAGSLQVSSYILVSMVTPASHQTEDLYPGSTQQLFSQLMSFCCSFPPVPQVILLKKMSVIHHFKHWMEKERVRKEKVLPKMKWRVWQLRGPFKSIE